MVLSEKDIYQTIGSQDDSFIYAYNYHNLEQKTINELIFFIYSNSFLSDEMKKRYVVSLFKTKQIIFTLYKFKQLLYRTYILQDKTLDESLCCIPLNEIDKRYKFSLIEDKFIYTFYINDLQTIIYKSLTISNNLYNNPTSPKNPYTNTPISISNLYNLYFYYQTHNIIIPTIFYKFFKSNFNITQFLYEHENYLRDISIDRYYTNIKQLELYYEIILVLRKYKKYIKHIQIHPDFDKRSIIKTFKPILKYDLYHMYSFNHAKKIFYKNKLIKYLKHINSTNPTYGRINHMPIHRIPIKQIIFKDMSKYNSNYFKADILSYKYKKIANVQTIINLILDNLLRNNPTQDNSPAPHIEYQFSFSYDDYGEPVETDYSTTPNTLDNFTFSNLATPYTINDFEID